MQKLGELDLYEVYRVARAVENVYRNTGGLVEHRTLMDELRDAIEKVEVRDDS